MSATPANPMMRVMVLGGYGLIGAEIIRRLRADGHTVIGFGRSAQKGRRLLPGIAWRGADLVTLQCAEDWAVHLQGVDAVVNASGALQDGARDDVNAVQDRAIRALIEACAKHAVNRFVQISAPGAEPNATTAFLRTKAAADAALRASPLAWAILKPALVISPHAYGGTALVRMLAAVPWVQPVALGDALIQTVAADDVAHAVATALTGEALLYRDTELAEATPHTLLEVIAAYRAWLGFAPARAVIRVPMILGAALGRCADAAGWLGWRSPLRTTALTVLREGVRADAKAGAAALGRPLKTLNEALADLPATMQERTYARAQLVLPLLVLTLAGFWIASGLIALVRVDAAANVLAATPLAPIATVLVVGGAILDIAIGLGVLIRKTVRWAAAAAVLLSLAYLALGTIATPQLWADPLGQFVKIAPGVALALAVAALTEER
jgi:uncharacterized protein YbjT (DUF2867 family)